MSDNQMLRFGSITEEDLKKSEGQSGKNPVSPPAQNGGFRFGSLEFPSLDLLESTLPVLQNKPVKQENTPNNKKGIVFSSNLLSNGTPKGSDSPTNGVVNNKKDDIKSENLQKSPKKTENSDGFQNVKKEDINHDSKANDLVKEIENGGAEIHESAKEEMNQNQNEVLKNEKKIRSNVLMPRGLINTGNLCFLNASLQALLSCSPFVELLQDLRDQNIPKVGYPTLSAFVDFISYFDMPIESSVNMNGKGGIECGKSLNPLMFDSVLRTFTPNLPTGTSARPRQEDAQEFLSFVMDQMHNELLKLNNSGSERENKTTVVSSSDDDDGWETVGPKNKTAITRTQTFLPSKLTEIFGGQLKSVVKATRIKASATVQPFLLLHLDIFPESVQNIEHALHLFSAPENLEGYRTNTSKAGAVSARKSVTLQSLPRIMILHLMRFSYGGQGSSKLHKKVLFPMQLSLSPKLISSSSDRRKYELVATVTHHGREPSKGHYTTDAKYSNGQWIRYDDGSVRAVTSKEVLQEHVYILFYKQV
ncbi:hypothetical protein LUZ60_014027 [Juncus effusus]|nr:hypothetical protein LUZ60_014027 [Juncus effusus]